MAVAPMTKAQVIIHGAASNEVVKRIYDLGILQAIEVIEDTKKEGKSQLHGLSDEMAHSLGEFEGQLREVSRALEILAAHDDSGRQLIENFITLKQRIHRRTIENVRESFGFLRISQQLQEFAEKLRHLQDQEEWLQDDIELLNTLESLPFPLAELRSTTKAKVVVGQIRKEAKDSLLEDLSKYDDRLYWEEITEKGQSVYIFLLYLPLEKSDRSQDKGINIPAILEQHGFDTLDLSQYSLRIPEELQRLTQKLVDVRKQREELHNEIQRFVQYKEQFKIIEDYLTNEIERCKDLQNFAETKKVYFVEGWMKQHDKQRLKDELREFEEMTEIFYVDPAPDDESVPVILENKWYVQPFEFVTQMFGMPGYNEPDPTPQLAVFFWIFFGLCLTDAGYGILLALFMWWLMRKYVLAPGTVQLARLLLFGGVSAFIFGILTGGCFGDLLNSLPNALAFITAAKNSITVIDPMEKPIEFLIGMLILGYIQVCFGIFIKMRLRMQQGDSRGALLDEGIWLIFINSLVFFAVIGASGMRSQPIGQIFYQVFRLTTIVSGAIRIWFSNREISVTETNILKRIVSVVKRLLLGILSLYDFVGIFSDVLSYSRLLALGLATGVIALVVNMLSKMVVDIPVPLIGYILGAVVFCFGHIVNLVINTLGAFVHSGRLQFVEFFSKFFEAGGKKYKPFKFESRYFEIIEQE
jgi:V/A-type H+-transporting ATPase subunit I